MDEEIYDVRTAVLEYDLRFFSAGGAQAPVLSMATV